MRIRMKDGHPVLDVADVVRLEHTIAERGTSLSELMQRAGHALAQAALAHCAPKETTETANLLADASLPSDAAPMVLVLCGSGNNGGDGWVAAREIAQAGFRVAVVSPKDAADISAKPAREQALITHNAALPTLHELIAPGNETLAELFDNCSLVIDAMLGTGFSGDEVREPYATWIRLANAQRTRGCRIVAADVPSGLSAQTGKAAEPCMKADETITMICLKPGLATPYAFAFCGEVHVAPLAKIDHILTAWQQEGEDAQPESPATTPSRGQSPAASPSIPDAFRRAENEDDDGYDPYSDRPPTPEPLFQENPWN